MKFKNKIALLLVLIMVINMLPTQLLVVNAFDSDQYRVNSVTIFKVYDANRNLEQRTLLITGRYLKDAEVGIVTKTGYKRLSKRTDNTEGLLQFELDDEHLGNTLLIEGEEIAINEEEMPTLTGATRKVEESIGDLTLQGTKLKNVESVDTISAGYEHKGAYTPIAKSLFTSDSQVTIEKPAGSLGLQSIIFEKKEIKNYTFNSENENVPVTITITYTYKDQFRLYKNIDIPDNDLTMYPNRGQRGDKVYFETPTGLLDSYDVFFLKQTDGTDPYTQKNKGKNKSYQENINEKDILTIEVPDIEVGEYFIVLTNAVSPNSDPMLEVTQEKILREKFTVISSSMKSKIISINPKSGPDTGSRATINAQFAGTMNIQDFEPSSTMTYSFFDNDKELVINYADGKYKNEDGFSASRELKIIIGDKVTFLRKSGSVNEPDATFSNELDTINIRTPQVTDADIQPRQDIVMEIQTIIKKGDTIIQTITERAVLVGGYTYILSKEEPTIESITPDKIQVVAEGNNYRTPIAAFDGDKGRLIAINGKNFMIHKYTDSGEDIIRYPIIRIGNIELNKNENPDIDLKVFNSLGLELDGSVGNELGSKILVYIKPETPVDSIGKTTLEVQNPIRNSMEPGLKDIKPDFIEFVVVDANKNPIISNVVPDTVATDGGVEVKVSGSNFLDGIRLFLDGEEMKNIKRGEDGKEITFTAPKGREGTTQLMVMNPEGGTATWPFSYVKTYTNPKITSFAPKSGNTGTLVVVKGDNFLQPDPAATPDMVNRLIGTRILLGEEDINEYMLDPVTKRIIFEEFAANSENPILSIKTEGSLTYIKAADYYNSVILIDEDTEKYYTLSIDGARRITLTDGINNNYLLEIEGTQIKANKTGGSIYNLEANHEGISIKDNDTVILSLIMKTPYKTASDGDGHKIIGNRVKVVDKNTIYFTVPALPADGYYDVTVLNPDTKRDAKRGTDGFLYFKQPQSKPEITKIEPDEGTTEGGYSIDIIGKEFDDLGIEKVKVFINGIQVAPADVLVSPDGKKITVLRVPKYPGDLFKEKGTNRYTVPVVILNPDGGSATKEDGFTYLVPTSHPKILDMVPAKGTAAGGDIVEISGSDFRFYEPYEDNNRNQIRDEDEWFNDINKNDLWDDLLDAINPGDPEPIELNHPRYDTYYASPILPKVFFGDKQAKIVEFGRGYLKVITPEGNVGKVDLYVVNNDSGISNKQSFTYESSNPRITRVFPGFGKMQGGDIVELLGNSFAISNMDIYKGETDENGNTRYDTKQMTAVRFGSFTNRYINRTEENSGRIDNNRATVRFTAANLTFEYDASKPDGTSLKLIKVIGDKSYSFEVKGYDNSVKYIPMNLLKDKDGNPINLSNDSEGQPQEATGLIRVEIDDRRLLVDTGYSDFVDFKGASQLFVKTPTYHTIGKNILVELINPDKGMAMAVFEYMNPYDFPMISSVEPINRVLKKSTGLVEEYEDNPTEDDEEYYTYVSLTGGVLLTIRGNNFKRTVKVYLDDKELQIIDRSADGTGLIVAVPPADESQEGLKKPIFVDNRDGGVATTRELNEYNKMKAPYFVVYQKGLSYPNIEKVIPDKTSAGGENIVTIIGSDFRDRLKVFIGGIEAQVQEIIGTERIRVKVPLGLIPGPASVMVQNHDFGVDEKKDILTIISSPWIEDVLDEHGLSISSKLFDMLGGQSIKIKGIGFMDGAQVIFGGKIKIQSQLEDGETGLGGININDEEVYVVGGTVISAGQLEDGIYLNITTPQMPEGKVSIIVLNRDGGVSQEFIEFESSRPIPDKPTAARAIAVDGDTVKLMWKGSGDAYQIFASIGEKENDKELNTYNYMLTVEPEIGDDGRFFYFVKNLIPDTWYRFRIISINEFGVSKDYAQTNKVKTPETIRSEYKFNDEYENPANRTDFMETTKDSFIYNVGEKTIKGAGNFYQIELRNKNIKDGLPRQIKIPVAVIQDYTKTFNIWDIDAALNFKNETIKTSEITELKGANRNDAVGIIEIYNPKGQRLDDLIMAAGRRPIVIKTVGIGFRLQKQVKVDTIKKFNLAMEMTIIMDEKFASTENLELYYYNAIKRTLEAVSFVKVPGQRTLKANIINPGEYIILGK